MFKILDLFKSKYPKLIKNVWYNRSVHSSSAKYPHVYDENGKYVNCRIGLKVVMFTTDEGKPVYYEVIDTHRSPGGDWLCDSDNINCDLKFSHIGELPVNKN